VTVPVTVVPDCVSTQVTVPGPVESVDVPVQVPATFAVSAGVVGVDGDAGVPAVLPVLPQDIHTSAAARRR
jgi:hypothetical protein